MVTAARAPTCVGLQKPIARYDDERLRSWLLAADEPPGTATSLSDFERRTAFRHPVETILAGEGPVHLAEVLARTLDRQADALLSCGRVSQPGRLAHLALAAAGARRRLGRRPHRRAVPVPDVPPQDLELAARLQAELPAILAWAIRGCLAWQTQRLAPPASVTAATDGYFTEQDGGVAGRAVQARADGRDVEPGAVHRLEDRGDGAGRGGREGKAVLGGAGEAGCEDADKDRGHVLRAEAAAFRDGSLVW